MKNSIKSPKEDSLRGLGKLGWTEGGRMNSTIKRLESSFSEEKVRSVKSNKDVIICTVCKARLRTNNTSRVPEHFRRYIWSSYKDSKEICKGSYSQQPSADSLVENLDFFEIYNSSNQRFNVGDKILIDASKEALKKYFNMQDSILEFVIEKIEKVTKILNSGELENVSSTLVYLAGFEKPIDIWDLGKWITLNN